MSQTVTVKPTTKHQPEKQIVKNSLFYISRSLFDNKKIKCRQRVRKAKWEELNEKTKKPQKTAKVKNVLLVPDETINLLSDEEQEHDPLTSNAEESILITSDSEDGLENKSQPSKSQMIPDETTVQTEIGNRVYQLSLTKLREGLASNEEAANVKRKRDLEKSAITSPPPPPVSIILSNDLSISLISDDEEETTETHNAAMHSTSLSSHKQQEIVGQLPKRRKLG